MGKIDTERAGLLAAPDRLLYLRRHSNLPGPRGNLELIAAAAEVGSPGELDAWIAAGCLGGDDPTDEFVVGCGVVGLGRLVAAGDTAQVERLRLFAADQRWRVREAVAMALQWIGDDDVGRMFAIAESWADDRPYVQRAAIAGVAEPRLLMTAEAQVRALAVVNRVTRSLAGQPPGRRKGDEFRVLRQALGYCWSVVVAAAPADGLPLFAQLAGSDDRDIAWIVRENRKKKRLSTLLDQLPARDRPLS